MTTTDEQRPGGARKRDRLETVRALHAIIAERIAKHAELDEALRTASARAGKEALEESEARKALAEATEDAGRRAKLIALKLETAQLEGQIPADAYRALVGAAFPGGAAAIGVQPGERFNALQRLAKALEESPAADPGGTLRKSAQTGAKAIEDANSATKKEEADKHGALQALADARTRWDEGYAASKEIVSGLLRDVGRRSELGALFVDLGGSAGADAPEGRLNEHVTPPSPHARDARLADGTLVHLRPLRADDEAEFVRGFAGLSAASRYSRFLDSMPKLTPEQVTYLTHVDGEDHVAWIVGYYDEAGVEHGAAVARSIREREDPQIAEFAIAVADAWQGRGVGRVLTETLARVVWDGGVRRWRATMLASNAPVQRCLARVGDEETRRMEDRGAIEVVYRLRDPSPG